MPPLDRFARATDGANLVEYIIVVGCVALLAVVGYRHFGQALTTTTEGLGNKVVALRETHPPDLAPSPQCNGTMCTNGTNCFAAGTPISTPEGLQPVEQIHAGDLVLSADPETGAIVFSRVAQTFVTPDHVVIDVRLRGHARALRVTRGHLWFTLDRGWTPTEELEPDEPLLRANGAIERIADLEALEMRETVYNFEVEGTHTYFVGEDRILVHNPRPDLSQGGNRINVRLPGGGRSQGLVVGNGPNGTYTVEVTTGLNGGRPVQGQPTTTTTMQVDGRGRVVAVVPSAGQAVRPYTTPLATGGQIDDGHGGHALPVSPPAARPADPQLGWMEGAITVGNHIVITRPENAPPGFQQEVLNHLNTLNGSPTGQALINSIDQAAHDVRINYGDGYNTRPQTNPYQPAGYQNGQPTDSTVTYNPYLNGMAIEPPWAGQGRHDISDGVLGPVLSGQGGSSMWATNKPPYITLGHEMAHASHFANGSTDFTNAQSTTGQQVPGMSGYEYQATGLGSHANDAITENNIRTDFGFPTRPFYGEQTELPFTPPPANGHSPPYAPPPPPPPSFLSQLNCFGGSP